jgi:hypothetical protein
MTIGSGVGFDRMFNGSVGMQANRMLDALGLPDKLGDLVGAQIDQSRGDYAGMMRNLQDLNSGMSTAQMDGMFGRGLPPKGFVPRPLSFLKGPLGMGMPVLPRGFNPFGGVTREAPFGKGFVGRQMERAIKRDPFFKSQMEQMLGGKIIPDRRNDGKLTIWRPPFSQVGGIMKQALGAAMLPNLGMAAALGGMNIPLAGAMMANRVAGTILGGMQRMEANIAAFAQGITGGDPRMGFSKQQLINDPQTQTMAQGMGIDVRNASFEDIIALLLMKYAKNKETDVMKKVQELDKSMQAGDKNKNGSGSQGGLGGLLGTAGGIVGNLVAPGVGGAIGGMAGNLLGGGIQSLTSGAGGGAGAGLGGTEMGQGMDPS